MEYKFVVKDGKDVDFQRICNEAPAKVNCIIVVANNAVALVRKSWLDRFGNVDKVMLQGAVLETFWGSKCVRGYSVDRGVMFTHNSSDKPVDGWRFSVISDNDDIPEFVRQFRAAEELKIVRKVTVSYL